MPTTTQLFSAFNLNLTSLRDFYRTVRSILRSCECPAQINAKIEAAKISVLDGWQVCSNVY